MNLAQPEIPPGLDGVPRERGDEPRALVLRREVSDVFPASAGMNR